MEIVGHSMTEIWEKLFLGLKHDGAKLSSRIGDVRETLGGEFLLLDITQSVVLNPTRALSPMYMVGELLWYLSGSSSVEHIAAYGKYWNELSDNGIDVNSAYGNRIMSMFGFNQLMFVRDLLKKDPLSRQAVIHIKSPSDKPSKDVPCTCDLQFFIRDGRLHQIAHMRSNDVWLGTPYDVIYFTTLQQMLANSLGVKYGWYHHIAGSLHLYEKDATNDVDFSRMSGEFILPDKDLASLFDNELVYRKKVHLSGVTRNYHSEFAYDMDNTLARKFNKDFSVDMQTPLFKTLWRNWNERTL